MNQSEKKKKSFIIDKLIMCCLINNLFKIHETIPNVFI